MISVTKYSDNVIIELHDWMTNYYLLINSNIIGDNVIDININIHIFKQLSTTLTKCKRLHCKDLINNATALKRHSNTYISLLNFTL